MGEVELGKSTPTDVGVEADFDSQVLGMVIVCELDNGPYTSADKMSSSSSSSTLSVFWLSRNGTCANMPQRKKSNDRRRQRWIQCCTRMIYHLVPEL